MKKILLLFFGLFVSLVSGQEAPEVRGTVTTTSDRPVQSATVLVKGTFQETTTDVNGAFRIKTNNSSWP